MPANSRWDLIRGLKGLRKSAKIYRQIRLQASGSVTLCLLDTRLDIFRDKKLPGYNCHSNVNNHNVESFKVQCFICATCRNNTYSK